MNGNLEPDERVLNGESWRSPWVSVILVKCWDGKWSLLATEKLGWEYGDDVTVEIGVNQVSGIDVGEVYNKKWKSPPLVSS